MTVSSPLPYTHVFGTVYMVALLAGFLLIVASVYWLFKLFTVSQFWQCSIVPLFLFIILFSLLLYSSIFILWRVFYFPRVDHVWSLGMVDNEKAKLWIRDYGDKEISIKYKEVGSNDFFNTNPMLLSSENDWTVVIMINKLKAKTQYEWEMVTQPPIPEILYYRGRFNTFPAPNEPVDMTFNFGSCIQPTLWIGMEFFQYWINQKINFALLLGDTIYTDLFGDVAHQQAYHQVFSDINFLKVFQIIPNFWMYDDHEIFNDYDRGAQQDYFEESLRHWKFYLGNKNPEPISKNGYYYHFDYGNIAFFMADTRMYRSKNSAPDEPGKTILGTEQKKELFDWLLLKHSEKKIFKFIVSSVPFTSLLYLPDGWKSFINERQEIINFIKDHSISGVVLLSADIHYPILSTISAPWLVEYSISPLHSIPLLPSISLDHNAISYGSNVNDTLLFLSSIEHSGYSYYFGNFQVKTTTDDGEYEFCIYAYNFGGRDPHVIYRQKRKLADTIPQVVEKKEADLPYFEAPKFNEKIDL